MTRAAVAAAGPASPQRIAKLTSRDVTRVLAELSDLLDAGCPLSRALSVLARQAKRVPVRRLLTRLGDDVLNGASLADAFARAGGHFSPVQVAMVRAAEAGGFLQTTLGHMAEFGRHRQDLLRRLRGAMTYPIVLLVTAIASVVFLMAFVVPRFSRVYEAAGSDLPWPTQVLLTASDVIAAWWWVGVAGIALVIGAVRLLLRSESIRLRSDGVLLAVPVAGPVVRDWALGEFCRCMSLLLDGGITVLVSLRLTSRAMSNRVMRAGVTDLADAVQQGEPMGRRMEGSRLFPPATAELIAIAEQSGNLPVVMNRLAGQYRRRLESRLSVLMSMVEPAIVLLVGALVALIVAGMLLPVLLMNTLIE